KITIYVNNEPKIYDNFYVYGKFEKTFSVTFKNSGEHKIKVVCEADDEYKKNNEFEFLIRVYKERTRILYLTGSPSYDYLFLRRYIKSKTDFELVSFVILREPFDFVPFSDKELSLIPFPTEIEFLKEIPSFDIYILHNFPFSLYGVSSKVIELIVNEVYKGKGLILIPSENFQNFSNTALFDISGVKKNTGYNLGVLHIQYENQKILFEGVRDIHIDAKSIMGEEYPLVAYRRTKNGTVIYINTDSLWKVSLFVSAEAFNKLIDTLFDVLKGFEPHFKLEVFPEDFYISDSVSINLIFKKENLKAKVFHNGSELKTFVKDNILHTKFFALENNRLDFEVYDRKNIYKFTKILKAKNPEVIRVAFNAENANAIIQASGGKLIKDIVKYKPQGYFSKEKLNINPFKEIEFLYLSIIFLFSSWILRRIKGRW
ncbi:MAG: hypothetical protein NZ870_01750, partial [bacterium]|nr:hypothetical protein [bacterium]